MKPFVLGRREKTKLVVAVVLGSAVLLYADLVSEIAYLPLYAALAILWIWGWLKGRSGGARSTGSR